MKNYISRAFCAFLAAVSLTGCGSRENSSGVSVADFGSSGGVVYSGAADGEASAAVSAENSAEEQTSAAASEEQPTESEAADPEAATALSSASETTAASTAAAAEQPPESTSAKPSSAKTEAASKTETTSKTEAATETTAKSETAAKSTSAAATVDVPEASEYDFGTNSYQAVNYSEIKGIWISYIELSELMQGQSKDGFRSNIAAVFDNCTDLGINTVYVHVRSHADAYYKSELFPWSKYITGTLGKDPGYDPLTVMLEEAHKRSLSFQAWINPLRACGTSQISSYGSYPVYTFATAAGMAGKYAVDVGGTYYLNPAYEEVTKLIAAGASEILSNYNVDGLHIDDYFYPTTDTSFDSSAYSASGCSSLSDFRFANCDRMVKELYGAVKSANPTALFSVSVQGNIDNNYTGLYADVRKWCTSSGYLDVIIPQIYYGFENTAAPYTATLLEWEELAAKGGIPLVAGLSVSKVGCEDSWAGSGKYEWVNNSDIISRQIAQAKKCSSYGGFALYSYRSVFSPDSSVSAAVNKEIAAVKEII